MPVVYFVKTRNVRIQGQSYWIMLDATLAERNVAHRAVRLPTAAALHVYVAELTACTSVQCVFEQTLSSSA
jgi:hypothetical protein